MFQRFKTRVKNQLLDYQILPHKPGLKILTYHGIVDEIRAPKLQRNFHTTDAFVSHLKLLKSKGFRVISSNELDTALENNRLKKTVWITFDDGYQNNLLAMEILNDFKFPATIFISTASIGSNTSIWTVNLSLLILKGRALTLTFDRKTFSLQSYQNRLETFQTIRQILKNLNAPQRIAHFENITTQFPVYELERLISEYHSFTMFNWKEIKELHLSGIDFQSHGHNHELHHDHQLESIIAEEVFKSKQLLKEHLNKNCSLFAYPNGNAEHKASKTILQAAGYSNAFILEQNQNSYPYQINRIDPNSKSDKFLRDLYLK